MKSAKSIAIAVFITGLLGILLTAKSINLRNSISSNFSPYWIRSSMLVDSIGNKYSAVFVKVPDVADYVFKGQKPSLYAALDKKDLILVSGEGEIFSASNLESLANGDRDQLEIKPIESNIASFFDQMIYEGDPIQTKGWFSVKGVVAHNDEVYVSYSRKHTEACWNTSILKGLRTKNQISFSEFWTNPECASESADEFNGHQAGGAIVYLGSDHILFSEGDYRQRAQAQVTGSILGKVFEINGKNNDVKVLAMGLRNPQGMIKVNNEVILTDQGPLGGDEVNIFNLDTLDKSKPVNFGWPISSYGEHYDRKFRPEAPLYKSHSQYGFIEPAIYYTPSIGISSITKVNFKVNGKLVYAAGALGSIESEGDRSLHFLTRSGINKFESLSILPVEDRVRSISEGPENCILVTLDSAAVGLICKVD